MGGAGFAVANLLLARHLSPHDYGHLSLVLAVTLVCIPLGPLSLDAMVLRNRPGPMTQLLKLSSITGVIGGILVALVASIVYSIEPGFLPIIAIAIAMGSITRVGASVYQSEKRYTWSLWLIQSSNLTLLAAAVASLLLVDFSEIMILAVFAAHWLLAAIVGWLSLKSLSGIKVADTLTASWKERLPLFGYLVTAQLTAQMDRLLIPKFLDLESLATFGVLAALVLAPFKMLELGTGYTLIPGLRTAETKVARGEILNHEVRIASIVIVLAIASGFLVAPWVADLFLQGKYELGWALIAAGVIAGTLRMCVVFVSSIVTALGSQARLEELNRRSWFALVVSVIAGWYGSRWGLPGVILGLAGGSLARLGFATAIALHAWRAPAKQAS
jgi:O-antigen/teichoic acid export membrane protein